MRNWKRFQRHRCVRAAVAVLYATIGLASLGATPIQWPVAAGGNDHYYELVDTGNFVSWLDAQALAQAAGGYLATITSSAENTFLTDLTAGTEAYIGASDALTEGVFTWVTGELFGFTNWAFQEPNDDMAPASPLGEDYTVINPPAPGNAPGTWNDVPDQSFRVMAYVVEYDTAPVPEPSTLLLLGGGALALFGAQRLRRRSDSAS